MASSLVNFWAHDNIVFDFILFNFIWHRKRNEDMLPVRQKAEQILKRRGQSLMSFYVSRQWISKFNTFAEPGPIDNHDFLCQHGGQIPYFLHGTAFLEFLETWKCHGIQLTSGKRPKVGESQRICEVRDIWLLAANTYELCMNCDVHGHVFRSSHNSPVVYSYCNSFFIRDAHGEFGLINVHLFDLLPAISCKKLRESRDFFFYGEW